MSEKADTRITDTLIEELQTALANAEAERFFLIERGDLLALCVSEAMPHVYRQQGHGKHEQDRADAVAWWEKWKEIRRLCGHYGKEGEE
jgi:hypothetical protein